MKAMISKSEVMKRAWQIYRMENSAIYRRGHYEFRFALVRAWKRVIQYSGKELDEAQNREKAHVQRKIREHRNKVRNEGIEAILTLLFALGMIGLYLLLNL